MIKLTARQQDVLECIRNAIENTGFPPTRKDIAQELGFRSANAAEEKSVTNIFKPRCFPRLASLSNNFFVFLSVVILPLPFIGG